MGLHSERVIRTLAIADPPSSSSDPRESLRARSRSLWRGFPSSSALSYVLVKFLLSAEATNPRISSKYPISESNLQHAVTLEFRKSLERLSEWRFHAVLSAELSQLVDHSFPAFCDVPLSVQANSVADKRGSVLNPLAVMGPKSCSPS